MKILRVLMLRQHEPIRLAAGDEHEEEFEDEGEFDEGKSEDEEDENDEDDEDEDEDEEEDVDSDPDNHDEEDDPEEEEDGEEQEDNDIGGDNDKGDPSRIKVALDEFVKYVLACRRNAATQAELTALTAQGKLMMRELKAAFGEAAFGAPRQPAHL